MQSLKKRLKIKSLECGEKMNEEASEILQHLPYSFKVPQEQEYITFLWDSFQSNYENRKYQFALIPFHMLFMSAVYFDIWKIKINNQNDFMKALIGLRKDDEKSMLNASWPFTFHKINESQILRFLKLLNCDDSKIGIYCKIVNDRNSVAHSNGNIYVQAQESLDVKIKEILRAIREITEHSKYLITEIFQNFLIQNWNNLEREYSEDKEQIYQLLIQKNYLSQKDIEFCINYDLNSVRDKEHFQEINNLFNSFKLEFADI